MGTRRLAICPGAAGVEAAQDAGAAALREFGRLEALWTTWSKDSDISRINTNAGKAPIAVSPETFQVLQQAAAGSELSGGLFDVTFGPLGALWKFDHPPQTHVEVKLERLPTASEVSQKRGKVNWRKLHLDAKQRTVLLEEEGMSVHLGGIGKGAAVDRVTALLKARGFSDFTVQAGRPLLPGKNGARPWRVGVAHPRQKGQLVGSIDVTDAAFSPAATTSALPHRWGALPPHHRPRTGYPATASQSATVLASTATQAEILTKTAFILAKKRAWPH